MDRDKDEKVGLKMKHKTLCERTWSKNKIHTKNRMAQNLKWQRKYEECSKDCGQLNFSQYFLFSFLSSYNIYFSLFHLLHFVGRLRFIQRIGLVKLCALQHIWMLNVDPYRTAIALFQKQRQPMKSKLFRLVCIPTPCRIVHSFSQWNVYFFSLFFFSYSCHLDRCWAQ